MIKGDSSEYNLITDYIQKLQIGDVCLTCEIGLREGLGTKTIIDAVRKHEPKFYKHIAIDPYGNLNYQHYDHEKNTMADYTEDMKQQTVSQLYKIYPEFTFFHMTDDYFFETMSQGHQFCIEGNLMMFGLYKIVHLDGPHTTKAIIDELSFFIPRIDSEGLIIIDDYPEMEMGIVDMLLKTYNFNVAAKGDNKIVYQKEI